MRFARLFAAIALLLGVACSTSTTTSDTVVEPPPPDNVNVVRSDGNESAPPPRQVEVVIGPEGGTILHPSGAALIVPTGALATRTRLTLTSIGKSSVEGALGEGFEAGPEGQTFLKPVELVLPFDPAQIPSSANVYNAQIRTAPHGSKSFVALDSHADLAARTIRTQTVHFSEFVAAIDPNPVFITAPISSLPNGERGSNYPSVQFGATGGTPPYSWSVGSGSTLTPGLSVSASGALSGIPTYASTAAFFITASDIAGHSVQRAFSLTTLLSDNPIPTLSSVTPSTTVAGSSDTTIDLVGTGFAPTSEVRWDGATLLASAFVSQTSLAATIPAALLPTSGSHSLTVFSPSPGGGTSSAFAFVISAPVPNPIPVISNITPSTALVESAAVAITVMGSSFTELTTITIGPPPQSLATAFLSDTQLTATIPASYLASATTWTINVSTPGPGGGVGVGLPFTVGTPMNPVASVTSLSPSNVLAGGASPFSVSVLGNDFVVGAQVFFGATPVTTTVVSPSLANVTVPGALRGSATSYVVKLVNPNQAPGTGTTSTFYVTMFSPMACNLNTAPTASGGVCYAGIESSCNMPKACINNVRQTLHCDCGGNPGAWSCQYVNSACP